MSGEILEDLVKTWLEEYQSAVRSGNPNEGLSLFSDSAACFGTEMNWCKYLPEFAKKDWGTMWPKARDFSFGEMLFLEVWEDSACCAVSWSYNKDLEGTPEQVSGRGTFVLQIQEDRFVAIHIHMSLTPEN